MAKRFVDTAIWDKPWFRKLPPEEKEAWRYICDKCDTVGVWEADTEIAEVFIGAKVDWQHLRDSCNGNIVVRENGKWFLPAFCAFQYGELVDTNNAHRSYIALLRKHGLSRAHEGQTRGSRAPLDKDKDKDKEKDKEPEEFSGFWEDYPRKVNRAGALKAWRARAHEDGFDPGEVMLALQNYKRQVAGKDPQYTMHPSTFLGPGLRWKDFLAPAKPVRRVVHKFCKSCGKEYWGSACDCGWSE